MRASSFVDLFPREFDAMTTVENSSRNSRGANYKEGLCDVIKNGLLLVLQATAVKQETREITSLMMICILNIYIYTHTGSQGFFTDA